MQQNIINCLFLKIIGRCPRFLDVNYAVFKKYFAKNVSRKRYIKFFRSFDNLRSCDLNISINGMPRKLFIAKKTTQHSPTFIKNSGRLSDKNVKCWVFSVKYGCIILICNFWDNKIVLPFVRLTLYAFTFEMLFSFSHCTKNEVFH